MLLNPNELIVLCLGFLIIALLYSSVGFGGGSSYLAILTLIFTSFFDIRTTALLCNLVVVTGSCYLYYKRGFMDFKKFIPFVITSIPLAFLGASFKLKEHIFFIILGTALIISALALVIQSIKLPSLEEIKKKYPPFLTFLLGGGIGLLSGMVGIGGGIFLAPILNHMKWEKSVKIAALASFFILVNSVSGLAGLIFNGTFQMPLWEGLALLVSVFIGGQLGIRISLSKLTGKGIKLTTATLVFMVGVRVLIVNGLQIPM